VAMLPPIPLHIATRGHLDGVYGIATRGYLVLPDLVSRLPDYGLFTEIEGWRAFVREADSIGEVLDPWAMSGFVKVGDELLGELSNGWGVGEVTEVDWSGEVGDESVYSGKVDVGADLVVEVVDVASQEVVAEVVEVGLEARVEEVEVEEVAAIVTEEPGGGRCR